MNQPEPNQADLNQPEWKQTACILCECNCGIEVRLGGDDGRRFERIRGDKAHPGSRGYTCEKALRLDHYQNGFERLTSPLRRRQDGSFEAIDWDTAISEIAQRFGSIRDEFGGDKILYYGGGGQGNHLGGSYSGATLRALGSVFRSSALAQEKTGEFFVNSRMLGTMVRGDFEHTEVAVFVGKNPWQSHGIAHARTVLKEIANDPARSMIVLDPRRTETADLADFHLQVKPGTDAYCLAAMVAVLVQERLVDRAWLGDHAVGLEQIEELFGAIDVADYASRCEVDESLIRGATRRIAGAASVAFAEDLGIQMNLHSTLNSWLEKLIWLLTNNLGVVGGMYSPTPLVTFARSDKRGAGRRSPVVGARIISGLLPCNVIPDEILTDHPDRYRALLVESGNPVHSLADTQRMREALAALDLVVVIDIAMTETARLADYVLPAPSQYEKWEATFFNFEFPHNVFHLRKPVLDPVRYSPNGPLPEPEIHARLVEALGAWDPADLAPLRAAAEQGRAEFSEAFFAATAASPALGALAPLVLYRTLGPTLPGGAASAAILWGAAHRCALNHEASVRRAGFEGEGLALGEALFDAILASPSGVTFAIDDWADASARFGHDDGRVLLVVDELVDELVALSQPSSDLSAEFPLVLSAGERRSFTANTIIRDSTWRKRDAEGALRISPADAAATGVVHGGIAILATARHQAVVTVEISDSMRPGHISLPNGMGLDEPLSDADGGTRLGRVGVAPNEFTDNARRDPVAGTPWHKFVPARVEAVS